MALTRKLLRSMGIEDDKIDQIIEAHSDTVNALKDERDQAKEEAAEVPTLREELEKLKAAPHDDYKAKYEEEHEAFESFKAKAAQADAERQKASLYRKALVDAGVDPKRVDAIMRVADLSEVEVEDGKLKDGDALTEGIKTEWADFIVQTGTKGAKPENPPTGDPGEKEPSSLKEALAQKYTHTD